MIFTGPDNEIKEDFHVNEEKSEAKRQYHVWLRPSTIDQSDTLFRIENCKNRSEFIEKAIRFYCGYILNNKENTLLPAAVSSVMEGKLEGFENRMARLLFKLAVEQAMMMHIIACDTDIDEVQLDQLRGQCIGEVKRTNGQISFKDALRYQKSL